MLGTIREREEVGERVGTVNRITKVVLDGYKGHRTVELGERTLLSGPNGLGKSAVLEGIRYALSGEVPTGKSLEEVAKYFPDRGGSVTVVDAAGNFISRGIEHDYEKKKISATLEQQGDAEWIANEALLDMRGFLALSPNKRREFVLRLVGAGETPTDQEIHVTLARDYAKQIGGLGADVSILDGRLDDLPEEIRSLAEKWLALWGVLSSHLRTGENTASAIFQRLVDAARERKNSSRRAAIEAKAAIRELEAAAKGARAAAAELKKRRYEAAEATERFGAAREQAARREQAQEALEAEDKNRAKLASRLEFCQTAVVETPGARPEVDVGDLIKEVARYRADGEETADLARDANDALELLSSFEDELSQGRTVVDALEKDIAQLESEPIARAVELVDTLKKDTSQLLITRTLRRRLNELLDLVEELAESWRTRRDAAIARLEAWRRDTSGLEQRCAELAKKTPSRDEYEGLMRKAFALRNQEKVAAAAMFERVKEKKQALEEWEVKSHRATEVCAEVKALKERYEAARAHHAELAAQVAQMPDPSLQGLERAAQAAKEALQEAEEAAGAVKAYEEAVERAQSEKVAENAWKAAEAACKRARETYVADIVKPLVDDVGALLAVAGRQEQVYLLLENDNGKPIFDLGWTLGESRRSLNALSGGEAILFVTALALTIAKRAAGRRVLLIEADPLDEDNLSLLLEALAAIDAELDACLVVTSSTEMYLDDVDGWCVTLFRSDGTIVSDIRTDTEPKQQETCEKDN